MILRRGEKQHEENWFISWKHGRALITAACRGNDPQDVIITYFLDKAQALAENLGCCVAKDNAEVVRSARYVMLAVKPQVLSSVLREIGPCSKNVSMRVNPRSWFP